MKFHDISIHLQPQLQNNQKWTMFCCVRTRGRRQGSHNDPPAVVNAKPSPPAPLESGKSTGSAMKDGNMAVLAGAGVAVAATAATVAVADAASNENNERDRDKDSGGGGGTAQGCCCGGADGGGGCGGGCGGGGCGGG